MRTLWTSGCSCEKILMFRLSELEETTSAAALETGWGKRPPHAVHDDRPCNCKHVPYCHPPLRKCAVSLHVFHRLRRYKSPPRCNQRLSKRCVVVKCDLLVGKAFPTSKIRRIDHMPDVPYRYVCCDRQEVGWLVSRVPPVDMI